MVRKQILLWTVAPRQQNQLIHIHKHSAIEEEFCACNIVEETSLMMSWEIERIASVLFAPLSKQQKATTKVYIMKQPTQLKAYIHWNRI